MECYRRRQTTDAREQNNTGPLHCVGGPAIIQQSQSSLHDVAAMFPWPIFTHVDGIAWVGFYRCLSVFFATRYLRNRWHLHRSPNLAYRCFMKSTGNSFLLGVERSKVKLMYRSSDLALMRMYATLGFPSCNAPPHKQCSSDTGIFPASLPRVRLPLNGGFSAAASRL